MRKPLLWACAIGTLIFGIGSVASVSATVPPPVDTVAPGDSIPDEQGGLLGIPQTTTLINPAATTTIPEGCFAQTIPQVVFVGRVEKVSDASVSFSIQKTISGDASAYVSGDGRVEIQYGTDGKFLDTGSVYIVGAVTDPFSPILVSKVRPETTTLGGAIVQTNTGDACPTFEDAVITLREDGSSVNTGVLRPLMKNKLLIVLVLLASVAIAFGGLATVVIMQRTKRGIARTMRRRKLFKQ
ncbi:MAG: hypothetical protein ACKOE0_01920 [Actinomycetes bacterium]